MTLQEVLIQHHFCLQVLGLPEDIMDYQIGLDY